MPRARTEAPPEPTAAVAGTAEAGAVYGPLPPGAGGVGRYENGMWLPGQAEGKQIQVNQQIQNQHNNPDIRISAPKAPDIDIDVIGGGGTGGEVTPIPVRVGPAPGGPAGGGEPAPEPTPPAGEEDPRDARIRQLEEQVRTLQDRLTGIEEQLTQIMNHLTDPTRTGPGGEPTPNPADPADPAEAEPPAEEDPRTAEIGRYETELEEARNELAKYSIRRQGRMDDLITIRPDLARKDLQKYEEALARYQELHTRLKALRVDMLMEAHDGDERAVRSELLADEKAEARALAEEEVRLNNDLMAAELSTEDKKFLGKIRAKALKFALWYSKRGKVTKTLIGLGVGGIAFGVTGLTGGALAPVVISVGLATRASLGLAGHKANLMNNPTKMLSTELKRIDKEYDSLLELEGDDLLAEARSTARLTGIVDKRVERRQNRNKVGTAVVLGGVAMGALSIAGVDVLPWNHHHSGGSNGTEHHGGGGGTDNHGGGGDHGGGGGEYPGGGNNYGTGTHHVELTGPENVTGLNLPQGMELVRSANGHLAIMDHGREVLNGANLPKGLFDTRGVLSKDGLAWFHSHGFNTNDAVKLADRFMTTIYREG